ncbi:hypothetical protein KIF53_07680 [Chromobacterium subtsugae]|uniref:Lipoprotein n=1 Tax=Chromobacterium subtsugae TaxID=251747 RepID=A0ABS7FBQ0_9NEIS|nr:MULTISPECIES: hypothetical protein [Chromobacterium]KUM03007.1 hypothetical protein Cv017_21640 [Chromobacterium subtsugae]KZE85966.1 hypothetical protein AWB61_18195 [Chromobacterium sp. F49]MBW7567339.1 hypothetical protein [Chromobacterium subtsugae]MBW8287505.1 hypothetical protein [Chromobacterium subtsugae]WSE93461.1 hypothetical protein U6115_09560 [Chromobacterium subtsugae]
MKALVLLTTLLALAGCNWVGTVSGLTKDSDKAVGAACRQTGRSLEECYLRNPEADKASIYAGWREMNEYMAKNKLETMAPPPEKPTGSSAAMSADRPASAAMSGGKNGDGPKPLTSEEADRAAKNDPQVEAVLAAMRNGSPSSAGSAARQSSGKGEPDQKRLLNIIQDLNKTDPGRAPG